ncbi:anti-sigma regulatory factor [Actinoplanes sp. KI2]|uniref:ATP-binding protein n=1 Tax=Actinoplanes sp. KI2 TaxID=2983315 RepID=UPI0021D5E96A|nr:anti-sigma regulatory factor [Actinoplanes sp. KI2]MCU7729567.1 anti-sigma regulatory factor [Actinoplanes sp. KI2]
MERLTLPAVLDSLEEVVAFVGGLACVAGLSEPQARRLRLATEEFVTNIVVHGHDGGVATAEMEIAGGVESDRVWLILIDRGPPFDPDTVGPPDDLNEPLARRRLGGLGLFLARDAADQITYEHSGGRNRTTIVVNRR